MTRRLQRPEARSRGQAGSDPWRQSSPATHLLSLNTSVSFLEIYSPPSPAFIIHDTNAIPRWLPSGGLSPLGARAAICRVREGLLLPIPKWARKATHPEACGSSCPLEKVSDTLRQAPEASGLFRGQVTSH